MKINSPDQAGTPGTTGGASGPAGGDLGGTLPSPTVVAIAGTPIADVLAQFLTVVGGGKGTVQAHGTLGATETVDLALGNYHWGTMDQDCTIGFTGWTSGKDCQIALELAEDGTGGWTPTLTGVTWIGGTPTWDTTAGSTTFVALFSRDGGTTIYAGVLGGGSAASDLDAILAASAGEDIADAMLGAAAPDAGNVFATMADVTGGGSGALILLEQHTASSSSSLDFTTFISSTYDTYKIEIVELVPQTNTANFKIQVGTGGGPTYDTGNNYEWAADGRATSGGAFSDAGSSGAGATLFLNMSNTAAYGFGTASLTASGLQSTSLRKTIHGHLYYVNATGPAAIEASWGMQWVTSGTAATALRFIMSSGNITSGTIRVYGVAK